MALGKKKAKQERQNIQAAAAMWRVGEASPAWKAGVGLGVFGFAAIVGNVALAASIGGASSLAWELMSRAPKHIAMQLGLERSGWAGVSKFLDAISAGVRRDGLSIVAQPLAWVAGKLLPRQGGLKFKKAVEEGFAKQDEILAGLLVDDPEGMSKAGAWRAANRRLSEGDPLGALEIWQASMFNPFWKSNGPRVEATGARPFYEAARDAASLMAVEMSVEDKIAAFAILGKMRSAVESAGGSWSKASFGVLAEASPSLAEPSSGASSFFKAPAPLAIEASVERKPVSAGSFSLFHSGPKSKGWALAASKRMDGESLLGLKSFGALAERHAGGLLAKREFGGGSGYEWSRALGIADGALESLDEAAPSKGAIPVSIGVGGLTGSMNSTFSAKTMGLLKLGMRERSEAMGVPLEKLRHPESAAAARMVSGLSTAAFMPAIFGEGSERVLLGLEPGVGVDALLKAFGEAGQIAGAASGPEERAAFGKAFALLHECFHLQQSWEQARLDMRGLDGELGSFASKAAAKLGEAKGHPAAGFGDGGGAAFSKWAAGMMEEAYADSMAAMALSRGDLKMAAALALEVSKARSMGGSELIAKHGGVVEKVLARFGGSKSGELGAADPHQTSAAMAALASALSAGEAAGLAPPSAQSMASLANACAVAGICSWAGSRLLGAGGPAEEIRDRRLAKLASAMFEELNPGQDALSEASRIALAEAMEVWRSESAPAAVISAAPRV